MGNAQSFARLEHAHMNFYVIVKSQDDYNTWLTSQEQSASTTPTDPTALAGQKLFLGSGGCQRLMACRLYLKDDQHLNNGADASVLVGPNLTHFGSRRDIAGSGPAMGPGYMCSRYWIRWKACDTESRCMRTVSNGSKIHRPSNLATIWLFDLSQIPRSLN